MLLYQEASQMVEAMKQNTIFNGLGRMEEILRQLDHPEEKITTIHIAGTNGKGSTLTYLKAILVEAGLTVGTFTSPYLEHYNDQIQINGKSISNEEFVTFMDEFKPVLKSLINSGYGAPVEFELMTAMALHYFASTAATDIVIMETGLGGRLDPTNVVKPLLSIITSVGLDHVEFLGNSLHSIAQEKAGIIKESVPIISGCVQSEVVDILQERAAILSSPFYQLGDHFFIEKTEDTFIYSSARKKVSGLQTGMIGEHQSRNAGLSVRAIDYLNETTEYFISVQNIKEGLQKAKIKDRIDIIEENPHIIFDGGHNPDGVEALVQTLSTHFPNKKYTFLFCAMRNKNIDEMITILLNSGQLVILTSFHNNLAMNLQELTNRYNESRNVVVAEDWKAAFMEAKKRLKMDDVLVVTGSLYFLREVRKELGMN